MEEKNKFTEFYYLLIKESVSYNKYNNNDNNYIIIIILLLKILSNDNYLIYLFKKYIT